MTMMTVVWTRSIVTTDMEYIMINILKNVMQNHLKKPQFECHETLPNRQPKRDVDTGLRIYPLGAGVRFARRRGARRNHMFVGSETVESFQKLPWIMQNWAKAMMTESKFGSSWWGAPAPMVRSFVTLLVKKA